MELNAEEIKRLLAEYEVVCDNCACNDGDEIGKKIMLNALALINSQEQRIKELTEENKARKGLNTMLNNELRRLGEENERLRAIPEQLHKEMSERMLEERKIERKLAVRKMQERFIAELRKDGRMNYYIRKVLDQVVKEMLEGKNEK